MQIWIKTLEGKFITRYREVDISVYSDSDNNWVYTLSSDDDGLYGTLGSKEEAQESAIIEVDYQKDGEEKEEHYI